MSLCQRCNAKPGTPWSCAETPSWTSLCSGCKLSVWRSKKGRVNQLLSRVRRARIKLGLSITLMSGCGLLVPQEPRKECPAPTISRPHRLVEDMVEASPDCRGYGLPDMGQGEGDVR